MLQHPARSTQPHHPLHEGKMHRETDQDRVCEYEHVYLVGGVGSPTSALSFTMFEENSLKSDQSVERDT